MKAISDVKFNKAVQKVREKLSKVGKAIATYEIGDNPGDPSLQDALIEQASQMTPGEERLVYFYDNLPAWFGQGYGVAKLYYHEGYEQGGSAFVAVDIFDANLRYHMAVVKDEFDGTWSCTQKVKVRTSADPDERGMLIEYDSGPANVQTYHAFPSANLILVTVSSGALIHTVTIDWRALGNSKDAAGANFTDPIWLPFDGVRLLASKSDGEVTFQIDDLDGGTASIRRIVGYN